MATEISQLRQGVLIQSLTTKCAGFVFLASVLMGHVLIGIGLVAAAVLHSVVDVFSLVVLRNEAGRNIPD